MLLAMATVLEEGSYSLIQTTIKSVLKFIIFILYIDGEPWFSRVKKTVMIKPLLL